MRSMRLASLITLLALAAPACALADNTRVLPVLSQDSGRVEALLLLDDTGSVPQGNTALDRVLAPLLPGRQKAGLRLDIGDGTRIGADLTLDAQNGLALLCRGNIGLAAALDTLGDHCLLTELSPQDPLISAAKPAHSVGIEGVWESSEHDFDIRFGLAWLDAPARNTSYGFAGLSQSTALGAELGELSVASLLPTDIHVHQLSLSSFNRIGDQAWMGVDGSVARGLASPLLGVPVRWDSTSLSLRGGYGAFSGVLTGRLIEVPNENQVSWFDVDLGVSWRTPWRARVTVGARNLLGHPDASQWPLTTLPRNTSESDTRTPYIRYHQDL